MHECLQMFSWLHADGKFRVHQAGATFDASAADLAKAKRMGLVALAQIKPAESEKPKKSKKADEE